MERTKRTYPWMLMLCILIGLCGWHVSAQPEDVAREPKLAKAVIVTCTQMIDDGLFQSLKRRTQEAIEGGADYLIYEISTYGGLVKS
ncbi:MAG: hypothetical protein HQ515_19990, partial [Phycisphaeraceae bacterium]|nr:hypothetical protein [Phycisphaeraceae bacterium]